FQLNAPAVGVDARGRCDAHLGGERGKRERLLIEVIECAGAKIAGLRPIVRITRIGKEGRTNAQLKIGERPVQDLDRKEAASVGSMLEESKPGARLDCDLAMRNRVGILETNWSAL